MRFFLGRQALRSFSGMRSRSMQTLPRLPVPSLHNTLKKYLKSLEPLLLEDEARGGACCESVMSERVKWAEKFENGVGKLCQERLLALDKSSPDNWLDDNFWMKKAYHEGRAPLPVHSNWWLALNNDNQVPRGVLSGYSQQEKAGITPWQIRRAAWLVHRTLEFKDRFESQEHYPDTTRTGSHPDFYGPGIWLRESTAKIFNIGRIPHEHCDTLSLVPPPSHPDARKIVIMLRDCFYAVEVYDEKCKLLNVGEIERRFRAVVEDVKVRFGRGERAVPVGLLTADERDLWATNLQYLLSLSTTNHQIHGTILNSLFCLSLDHYSHVVPCHSYIPPTPSAFPDADHTPLLDSPAEIDAHLHNIRSGRNAHNRWFDKAYTLIVESNTSAGVMGEHSPIDALVPSIVAEYAIVEGVHGDAFERDLGFANDEDASVVGWQRLDWVVDDRIEKECATAAEKVKEIIDNSDDSVFWFSDYGADWIKTVAKFPPDAFLQMVLQLAWYKTRGEFTATYETALTRMFNRGRTETIRTLTTDSRAFVLSMVDSQKSTSERYRLLQRAIQTHTALTREAATGRGIDRHLLGLRLMLHPDKGERAELFDDELFERSQRWKLSTSGLSAGHQFRGTGFGSAYEDGYGINYLAAPDIVKFGIESKHSSQLTSTLQFKSAIRDALQQMRSVCLGDIRDLVHVSSSL